jgi:hypothetical protein
MEILIMVSVVLIIGGTLLWVAYKETSDKEK